MFDLQVPFFIPVWRRVGTTGVTLGWAAFEYLTGSPGWALLFAGAGAYCFYSFFVVWDPKRDDRSEDAD